MKRDDPCRMPNGNGGFAGRRKGRAERLIYAVYLYEVFVIYLGSRFALSLAVECSTWCGVDCLRVPTKQAYLTLLQHLGYLGLVFTALITRSRLLATNHINNNNANIKIITTPQTRTDGDDRGGSEPDVPRDLRGAVPRAERRGCAGGVLRRGRENAIHW